MEQKNSSKISQITVVGVDLGSSKTKIAAVINGAVDIVTNDANFRETPTVVGFGPNERFIGELGYAKIKSNLKNTIISPQRYFGFKNNC
jgi:molecular chaperone DnaK (HSP70)